MDAGDLDPSSSWGTLKNCLVGSWKKTPDSIPSTRELESWAKAVWKLKGGILVAFLNRDLMLFEFDFLEESNYVLERRGPELREMGARIGLREKQELGGGGMGQGGRVTLTLMDP